MITYIGLGLWSAIFIGMLRNFTCLRNFPISGIICCVLVLGLQEVLSVFTTAADVVRLKSHVYVHILFFAVILILGVCAFPGMSILEMTCGFVLGFDEGMLVSCLGIIFASCVAFFLGRYYLKSHITKYLDQSDKDTLKLFLTSIERKNGIFLLILFRLMFIPFFMKNYGPSVIKTSFLDYFIAVILTTPPYVALFTFMGSQAKSIADLANGTPKAGQHEINWMEVVPVVVSVIAGAVFTTLAYFEFKKLQAGISSSEYSHLTTNEDEESLLTTGLDGK